MSPLEILGAKKAEIDGLCRQFCVKRLRLFGSALTKEWDEHKSDFDFLVEYTPEAESLPPLECLVGLQIALEDLIGRKVDVVDWDAARNRFFRQSAESQTQELYAA